jgi:hypothetical protein
MIQHSENMKLVKKIYKRPSLLKVNVDSDLCLVMISEPPLDPNGQSGMGTMPGYVQKGIKFLIR